MSKIDELATLAELKEKGHITDDEFEEQKKILLGSAPIEPLDLNEEFTLAELETDNSSSLTAKPEKKNQITTKKGLSKRKAKKSIFHETSKHGTGIGKTEAGLSIYTDGQGISIARLMILILKLFAAAAVLFFIVKCSSNTTTNDTKKNGSVESAYKLCHAIEESGLSTAECEFSVLTFSVEARMNVSSSTAAKLCIMMSDTMKKNGYNFQPGWKLKIYSPFSGDNTIALCNL
ncbi:SHOCT domain-containing protein [Amphritea sp.]|uniref:SHOCT domain-containing protein n=1 Tax=Amphritea sp. TaxID=1872502 RepID=UPI003A8D2888